MEAVLCPHNPLPAFRSSDHSQKRAEAGESLDSDSSLGGWDHPDQADYPSCPATLEPPWVGD